MNVEAQTAPTEVRVPFFGRRILVVDDDEDVRYLHSMMLSRAGYIVDTAADGEEAWKMLLSTPYDLLLTDHNMPLLCGLDLVARMRAARMSLPIIINSGCLNLGDASNHHHLDLAAILHKPFEFSDVLKVVKRILPIPPDKEEEEAVQNGPAAASKVIPLRLQLVTVPVPPPGVATVFI